MKVALFTMKCRLSLVILYVHLADQHVLFLPEMGILQARNLPSMKADNQTGMNNELTIYITSVSVCRLYLGKALRWQKMKTKFQIIR